MTNKSYTMITGTDSNTSHIERVDGGDQEEMNSKTLHLVQITLRKIGRILGNPQRATTSHFLGSSNFMLYRYFMLYHSWEVWIDLSELW